MPRQRSNPQATREETVSIRLFQTEKRGLKLLAAWRNTTESELLRQYSIREIVKRAARIGSKEENAA